MQTLKTVIVSTLLASLLGCGAIFNGTRQTITAHSTPDGAILTTEPSTARYTTPASISLERKHEYVLRCEKEGYTPAEFQIQKKLQGGIVVLDVLFTGLIGVVVDGATGAWFKLSPENATLTMTRIDETVEGPKTIQVRVGFKDNVLSIESDREVTFSVNQH